MPATKPVPGRRVMSIASAVVSVVALGFGPLACAGHHHINTAPPHPIAVQINNNLTVPTELTVYVAQGEEGGPRQMLGTVPGAQSKTFTFTPIAWDMTYRLVGQRPLGGPVTSPRFTVNDPQTGVVSWNVIPNQVQFYDVQVDTTKTATPGTH